MTVQPGSLTRQQLYDRIRESSKDEVILEEMIRLGFWRPGEGEPTLPGELIKRRGDIQREIGELHKQQALWRDPETALKEMHKRRKKEALQWRKDTKLLNAKSRHERALAWHERRKSEILYLGEGVSAGLRPDASTRPLKSGLPEIASPKALADLMGVPLGELRFLAYDRALSRTSHYQRFTIPKKTGGERLISAPMPRLKRTQYWVLDNVLAKVPVHPAAHGFVPDRSILTNARQHVGRDVVVNLDLKDFFPTLTFRRVKGKFRGLGYPEAVATVLALLCTEPDTDEVELDGERLFVSRGPRRLPQGAPTSPMLTNLVCKRLDTRLFALAGSLGFTYTRYADDMTFSASGEGAGKVAILLKIVGEIVQNEGFTVHPDKTRAMRRGRRQEVTGLTVNERVAVPRDTLRRFRALLHGIEKTGPEGKRWGVARDVFEGAEGFAYFVRMVTPDLGEELVTEARALAARHGKAPPPPASRRVAFRAASARPELGLPLKRWWTPAEPEPPKPEPILVEPPKPAPPPVPPVRSALGAAAGARSRMQQEPRGSVWGQVPPPQTAPTQSSGGVIGMLFRLARNLFLLSAALIVFALGIGIAPRLTFLAVFFLIGFYAYRYFSKR